jgi:A/G-specific adenine glycosylase
MDYGAFLKQHIGNQNTRSKHYSSQAPFAGSDRQIRGALVRMLTHTDLVTRRQMQRTLTHVDPLRIDAQLTRLVEEGMVLKRGSRYQLPS